MAALEVPSVRSYRVLCKKNRGWGWYRFRFLIERKEKKNNGGYALELTLAVSVDNLIYGCVSLEYALHIYIYYIPT